MIGLRNEAEFPDSPPPSPSKAPAVTSRIFAEGGVLQSALRLEFRPQQAEMASTVARAFAEDAPLLFEAGTGVGKSLAYLLPGIVQAMDQSRQLIVSTHTISLQEQLETKDLPICRRVLAALPDGANFASFRSCMLLGKGNYLCTTRLSLTLADRATILPDDEYAELQRIADWAEHSETGIRHELAPPPRPEVWELVNADSSSCARKHCNEKVCFYQRARARIREAHVIIVNHALLFALINAGGARVNGARSGARGILFPDDFLVIDEAHTVAEVASDKFGLHLSSYGVDRALRQLFNPKTSRGLFMKHRSETGQGLVAGTIKASQAFFGNLAVSLLGERQIVRLREPGCSDAELGGALGALERLLAQMADRFDDGHDRDEFLDQKARIQAIQTGLKEWLSLADEKSVYWAERSGKRQTIVTLRSAPLDVAPQLHQRLFGCRTSVVCTSATLEIGGSLEPFAQRIGAQGARAVSVASPFDYERNMRVYIAADMPLPSRQEARLALDALTDYVGFCVRKVSGGTLVLFTSYSDMRAVAQSLADELREQGRPLLMQGESLSRTELAREMRRAGDAILFGTDSFWTGVDVPGAALSQVIVTRLPFDPPTHPLLEARSDAIRDAGGNPFAELTLPESIIRFRQGVGRLIRTASDRGVITILDSRVLAKTYGRLFLEALPQREHVRITRADREMKFRPF
ncbi:MAG: ATP-dependent DNA helicase [Opitutaceae bacterium]|nr:ATP-dependent DNA helicase [Opitutaceae bacterium]